MRKLFCVSLLLVFLTGCTASAQQELVIEGPEEFQTTVQNALALIEEKSPEQYRNVQRLVKQVVLEETAPTKEWHAWCDSTGAVHILSHPLPGPFTDPLEKTSVALSLIHETAHLRQMAEQRLGKPEDDEREALQAERVFLAALGFDGEFLDWVCGEERLKNRPWEKLP